MSTIVDTLRGTGTVSYRVSLPGKLAARYEDKAEKAGIAVEELLADRLAPAVNRDDSKPIYITDEQRRVIDDLLQLNVETPQKLVSELQKLVKISVGDVRIALPPLLLERMSTRLFGLTFEEVLTREVIEGLEKFAEMR
jgi:hypothetical protein